MSKPNILDLWNKFYGHRETVTDYAGRIMKRSACSNPNSAFHPTIDHIRPLSARGTNAEGNLVICHRDTNHEKADHFPHWKANGIVFRAERVKGTRTDYTIFKI